MIYCVEDERNIRELLIYTLETTGFKARGFGNGNELMKALKEEKINKVSLIAFTENDIGNAFWNTIGWTERLYVNYYYFILNEENITAFNEQ